jgi:hypothetical protein
VCERGGEGREREREETRREEGEEEGEEEFTHTHTQAHIPYLQTSRLLPLNATQQPKATKM